MIKFGPFCDLDHFVTILRFVDHFDHDIVVGVDIAE